MAKQFPHYRQLDAMDCGAACVRMIAKHHGKHFTSQFLREATFVDREGVSLKGIAIAAEKLGMRTLAIKVPFKVDEKDEVDLFSLPTPFVAHWDNNHFVVVHDYDKKFIYVADPASNLVRYKHSEFKHKWVSDGNAGLGMVFEPSPEFYQIDDEKVSNTSFVYLYKYLLPYRYLIVQLIIGLVLGTLFQLVLPFMTQAVVDIGIQNQDINFVWLILIGQLVLFFSQTSVQFIQSWILLHIGTRVNVGLLNDFLARLMKKPLAFFDKKMIGDLIQRIGDHERIEEFLTTSTLGILFSTFNIVVFSVVLLFYHWGVFLVFLFASILYIWWIFLFLRRRTVVDHMVFEQRSENQRTIIELLQGMQEIKLQNSERKHRWNWAGIQAKLFKANIRALKIDQYQDAGAVFISQLKDIIITFISATAVINGQMTLGMLLAVQYIVGQMNGPLTQFVSFIRTGHDAQLSLERLSEIHAELDESSKVQNISVNAETIQGKDLLIEDVTFRYNELQRDILKNVSVVIPGGKVTAIVGGSGSGKTTLIKLLLGFYKPNFGKVYIGGMDLSKIDIDAWRDLCGAVMQDGYIFSDTIASNIAESDGDALAKIDNDRLQRAVNLANIKDFIESQPLAYNTLIGNKGNGLSQGQKQRMLIARAVYKNPEILFFDEATNALDATNEKVIVEKLNQFYQKKTVVIVAHRLSTVKDADKIIVLDAGEVVEEGTHKELVFKRGAYYNLVSNQLELGS